MNVVEDEVGGLLGLMLHPHATETLRPLCATSASHCPCERLCVRRETHLSILVLAPVDGTRQVAVPEHPPPQERQGDVLGEEDLADIRGHVFEGPADASHHQILEQGGIFDEPGLVDGGCPVSPLQELVGEFDY